MNGPSQFDLNRAIQQWREDLAQSPALHGENLEELEAHLRDSVAALQSKGLSAEEAFFVGVKRLGPNRALEIEYSHVNRDSIWLDRVLWMLIGIQVWGLVSGLVYSIARNGYAFGWRHFDYDWKTDGLALPVMLFSVGQVIAFAASVAFCWWLIVRKGRKLLTQLAPRLQRRGTFVATIIVLCLFGVCVNLFSSALSVLLIRTYGPDKVRDAMMYSSYAHIWVLPFQMTAMIVATLVLVRRRLRQATA